ncbi:hypothetical protein EX30DRAFT_364079 [Ascodesmis nigricans]|uniref:RBR-type E3 ubiquitin transferase n=1 Tax=Ascodesmis nigricans TaxID=341454 RepID=A0A4S2MWK1_9PEZI|nr:hypothetical protein EX30DRAFT_364079 [Ascodesmis nigricans]
MAPTAESLSESTDERSLELSSIAFIFPNETNLHTPFSATFTIAVNPRIPTLTSFSTFEKPVRIHHFPPLQLVATLPETYPATSPPEIELKSDPAWIPAEKLQELGTDIHQLWEAYHDQILYSAIDHLQTTAEQCFGLMSSDSPVLQLPANLKQRVVCYNDTQRKKSFESQTYDCGICLEPKKGIVCHQIRSCGHVFCRDCLKDYFTAAITAGDISSVQCSDFDCRKEQKEKQRKKKISSPSSSDDSNPPKPNRELPPPTLPPDELEEIGLGTKIITRYITMKKKKALEMDPTTIYCPRPFCQGPAKSCVTALEVEMAKSGDGYWLKDLDSSATSSTSSSSYLFPVSLADEAAKKHHDELSNNIKALPRLQVCSLCTFAFCRVCENSWHGDYQICKAKDAELTEEEKANEKFLEEKTAKCPSCWCPVIKSHGCNHISCTCGVHFCFLCSDYLDTRFPYGHFNIEGTWCYQRLWEGEEGDGEFRRAQEGFHAPAVAAAPPPPVIPPPPPERRPTPPPRPFIIGIDVNAGAGRGHAIAAVEINGNHGRGNANPAAEDNARVDERGNANVNAAAVNDREIPRIHPDPDARAIPRANPGPAPNALVNRRPNPRPNANRNANRNANVNVNGAAVAAPANWHQHQQLIVEELGLDPAELVELIFDDGGLGGDNDGGGEMRWEVETPAAGRRRRRGRGWGRGRGGGGGGGGEERN